MYVLQIEEFMEHSDCDWVETSCLCVSESKEKLQDLANKIKEESIEYSNIKIKILYTKDLSQIMKHEMLMAAHKTFKHLSEYQIFREIDGSESELFIAEIKVI